MIKFIIILLCLWCCTCYATKKVYINIHITHHAGTKMCFFGHLNWKVGKFACFYEGSGPFPRNDEYIDRALHDDIGLINWEYRTPPKIPLSQVNWESDKIGSFYVGRHPIDRLLAADGAYTKFGRLKSRTNEQWEAFLKTMYVDNYNLSILSGGLKNKEGFEKAKKLARRFSYLFDVACLEESLKKFAEEQGLKYEFHKVVYNKHPPYWERIHNKTRVKYLENLNKWDIEFYKWVKNNAYLKC